MLVVMMMVMTMMVNDDDVGDSGDRNDGDGD